MTQYKKRSDVSARVRTAGARSPAERLEPGRAPKRPRGLQDREPSRVVATSVRVISGIFTVALVMMLLLGGISFAIIRQFENPGPLQATRNVVIPSGGRIAIAELLEREGVITNRWTFVGGHILQTFMGGDRKANELKAGEYQIQQHASMHEVLDTLTKGKSIPYKLTLPEGLTSQQIVERIKAEPNLTGEIANVPAEGTLLPDTYYFSKGSSRQDIVNRMQEQMQKSLAALWEKKNPQLPLRSAQELVTFASIVEKETGRPDERDRVAAVFYNRLRKGMRLQSDPTIIYGLVGGQGSLGRSITKNDMDERTPYNTYQINGLPPGPICNPGASALQAALVPAETADLYFVADGSGGHTFSETLKEHNSAVQKWRETEKQQAKAKQDAQTPSEADANAAPIPPDGAQAASKKTKATQDAATPAAADAKEPATAQSADASAADIPLPTRKPKRQ